VTAPSEPFEKLGERFVTDPFFHALVEAIRSDWTDDDGCYHAGPVVADAIRVETFLARIDDLGFLVVPKAAPRVRCPSCEHEFTLGDS
jgi:hypothetical protein